VITCAQPRTAAGFNRIEGARVLSPVCFPSNSEGTTKAFPRCALKLRLNDSPCINEPEVSRCRWGFGFRIGFLGCCSMDIVQERLEAGSYNLELRDQRADRWSY